ncbi:MAG: endonuclease/exonuclease/phosphatase family protein [Candidatus Nanoarchaeia archaeon]
MKLISLNIWGGHEFEALMTFVKEQSKDTDIFCFQEIFDTPTERKIVEKEYRANILSELNSALQEYNIYYVPTHENWGIMEPADFEISFGVAMFIKKNIAVKKMETKFIFGDYNIKVNGSHPRCLQHIQIISSGKEYNILQFHGLWGKGMKKIDNEHRIMQSTKVKEFMDKIKGKKILCGDFNLNPDTESISILEQNMINLIKDKKIVSTRSNKHYEKPTRYADYTIVSPDVEVESFEVPQMDISDHLPMILKFS